MTFRGRGHATRSVVPAFVVSDHEVALAVDRRGHAFAVDDLDVDAGELDCRLAAHSRRNILDVRQEHLQCFALFARQPGATFWPFWSFLAFFSCFPFASPFAFLTRFTLWTRLAFRSPFAFRAVPALLAFLPQRRELVSLLARAVLGSEDRVAFLLARTALQSKPSPQSPSPRPNPPPPTPEPPSTLSSLSLHSLGRTRASPLHRSQALPAPPR